MQLRLMSVMVNDQTKAETFYTELLGFLEKRDIPLGQCKWLTVASTEGPDDVELLVEPKAHLAAQVFQQALLEAAIPPVAFAVADTQKEHDRLFALGVTFKQKPAPKGPTVVADFDDTCGNFIQIFQA